MVVWGRIEAGMCRWEVPVVSYLLRAVCGSGGAEVELVAVSVS